MSCCGLLWLSVLVGSFFALIFTGVSDFWRSLLSLFLREAQQGSRKGGVLKSLIDWIPRFFTNMKFQIEEETQ
jgi:hypothetical protein